MNTHVYIYYKVYKLNTPELCSQAQLMIRSMRSACDKSMLRKRSGSSEHDTYMEVYEGVSQEFKSLYAANLAREDCSALRQLERHEEWFEDVPDCL
jgi:Domain of unknown function (DUF4936)